MGDLFHELTGHANDSAVDFLAHWMALTDLEEVRHHVGTKHV
jgi:hypothetical protein